MQSIYIKIWHEDPFVYQRHSNYAADFRSIVNLNSFVDWFLINQITENIDAGAFCSSVHLIITAEGKIEMRAVWDFDVSLACDYEGWLTRYIHWFELFLQDPFFTNVVQERFDDFHSNRLEIIEKVDRYSKYLQVAAQKNDLNGQL